MARIGKTHAAPMELASLVDIAGYRHGAPLGLAPLFDIGCYKHLAPLGLGMDGARGPRPT